MLEKQRCPHTGIVNYFVASEPNLSVACVVERRSGLVWLCHLSETGGRADSVAEADIAVRQALDVSERRSSTRTMPAQRPV